MGKNKQWKASMATEQPVAVVGPSDVTGLTATVEAQPDGKEVVALKWTQPVIFAGGSVYEVRAGVAWVDAVILGESNGPSFLVSEPHPTGSYWVAAKDAAGAYDPHPGNVVLSAEPEDEPAAPLADEPKHWQVKLKAGQGHQIWAPSEDAVRAWTLEFYGEDHEIVSIVPLN